MGGFLLHGFSHGLLHPALRLTGAVCPLRRRERGRRARLAATEPTKDSTMAKSSLLGGERAAVHPSGKGSDLLGPSDSSDSGSDAQGELGPDQLSSDSDRSGTGERASADLGDSGNGADILPDRVDRMGGALKEASWRPCHAGWRPVSP
jgi:hypothetical protein